MPEILNKIIIDPTNHISFVVLIIGFISNYLKPFIKSQDLFENDIQLILSEIKESICKEHALLLKATIDIDSSSALRGTPPNTPDLIGNYNTSLFKSIERTLKLKRLLKKVRSVYNFLFLSTIIGLIVLVFNLVSKNIMELNFNKYVIMTVTVLMTALFLGQIYGLFQLRKIEEKNKFFKEEILGSN